MKEEWKQIQEADRYLISSAGRVYSLITRKFIKPYDNGNKYLCVRLSTYTGSHKFFVHILVTKAFIDNPDNLPQVNHKDGNKANPIYTNLEWVTQTTNQFHAVTTGLQKSRKGLFGKEVQQFTLSGQFIHVYPSYKEAARNVMVSSVAIRSAAEGYTSQAGGFLWQLTGKETT